MDPGNCCHHPVASRVDTVTFQRERSRYTVRTHITIDVSRSTVPLRSAPDRTCCLGAPNPHLSSCSKVHLSTWMLSKQDQNRSWFDNNSSCLMNRFLILLASMCTCGNHAQAELIDKSCIVHVEAIVDMRRTHHYRYNHVFSYHLLKAVSQRWNPYSTLFDSLHPGFQLA